MADVFDFYVYDNRSIVHTSPEPIMQEDKDVAVWRFRIPKVLNNIDMSAWAWWFVYVNAKNQKFSELLTLTNDIDDPENYCTADYPIGYGISKTPGGFTFALEAISAEQGGEISGEWHTRTYTHTVTPTLQGNQAEYTETESDIISALIVEVQNKYNALVGGATPLPVNLKSLMTDHDKVYLYTGSEEGESTRYWYYYNGTQFVPGGLYAAGIVVDSIPTENSTNAVQSGAVKEIADRVAELEADTVYTLIGNTPITLEADTEVRLSATQQTEYTLSGLFLADYNSNDEEAEVRLNETTLTKENGKMIFTATGENIFQCYADLRLNNLTIGETYTLTITRGEYVSGTTGGYFRIYDRDGTELGSKDVTQDVETIVFTATTTFARVRLFPTTNYYYEAYGITTATIVNAVVTKQRAGTFSTTTDLGNLAAGVTISASPACSVYSITRESDIDEALSAVSRNPVQNRAIVAAIGQLSDLATSAKGNLVAAINEAASSSGSTLTGKRCVFLGDSVSAFQAPPGDIPSIVGAATGMTVVNGCFGGCRITDTVTDEYGSFSFVKLVDAIVSGDWTQQDTDVATLDNLEDEYSPTDHLTALKAVNWNNVDILVVHWAGNDPGNVRIDDPTNDENTSYYLGALRYCIRKLWTNFPQLKILYANCTYHEWPSLNTNTDDREYTIDGQTYHYYDWGDAILEEAKKLKFPTLDLYRTSCIGPQNVAYWMSSDLTHPKPRGNQLIAGKIAAKLLSEF